MKKIIGFDLDGTLVRSDVTQESHHFWFEEMAKLCNNPEILKWEDERDYMKYAFKAMEEYTGLSHNNKEEEHILRKTIRTFYQMLTFKIITSRGKESMYFKWSLLFTKLKKKGYSLALITTSPEDIVTIWKNELGLDKYFDIILKTTITENPDKNMLFDRFVNEYEKPILYIGNSERDFIPCKKYNIPFILATWDPKSKGFDHLDVPKVENLKELEEQLEIIIGEKL